MFELTQHQKFTLESYIDDLEATKLVSKNLVQSLEESIGVNIVTDKVSTARLTEFGTSTNYARVMEILKEARDTCKITDLITANDAVNLATTYNKYLGDYIYLFKQLLEIKPETLSRMVDIKYTSYFLENTLIDIAKEKGIFDVFENHKDFVLSLCGTTSKGMHAYDAIYEWFSEMILQSSNTITNMPTLLGSLLDTEGFIGAISRGELYCKKEFTLCDMQQIISNLPTIIELLNRCYVSANPDALGSTGYGDGIPLNYVDNGMYYWAPESAAAKTKTGYTTLSNITNVLKNDFESLTILRMFRSLC